VLWRELLGPEKLVNLSAARTGNLPGTVGRAGIDDDDLAEEGTGAGEAVSQDALLILDDHAKHDIGTASEFLYLSEAQVGMLARIEEDAFGSETGQVGGITVFQVCLPLLAVESSVCFIPAGGCYESGLEEGDSLACYGSMITRLGKCCHEALSRT
jgi:hypothetical protein